jgi:hypothetical protein
MDDSLKTQGFAQSIFKVSTTKREMLGQLRILPDGRKFRYARAGGTLAAGGMCGMNGATANHVAQIQTSGAANAAGATVVSVYVGATAVVAGEYVDGFLQIYDGTAGTTGFQYRITDHAASAAGSAIISVTLAEPIQVATVVGDYFSLIPCPWYSVTHTTSRTAGPAGVAMKVATVGQYLWLQTGGCAICKAEGTAAIGSKIGISNTAQEIELDDAYTSANAGFVYGYANATGKWVPVFLQIE